MQHSTNSLAQIQTGPVLWPDLDTVTYFGHGIVYFLSSQCWMDRAQNKWPWTLPLALIVTHGTDAAGHQSINQSISLFVEPGTNKQRFGIVSGTTRHTRLTRRNNKHEMETLKTLETSVPNFMKIGLVLSRDHAEPNERTNCHNKPASWRKLEESDHSDELKNRMDMVASDSE